MTFDVMSFIDGTSKQQTLKQNKNTDEYDTLSTHLIYDPSLKPITLSNHPKSKLSGTFANFVNQQ